MWFTRRSWLRATGLASLAGSFVGGARLSGQGSRQALHPPHDARVMGTVGRIAPDGFDPSTYLRTWNFGELPPAERTKFYRETPRPDGTMLREYEMFAVER